MLGLPEIIALKKTVVLGLLDGDVDGSCSGLVLQEIPDADGIVGGRCSSLVDDDQNLYQQQQQPQCPASSTHLLQL